MLTNINSRVLLSLAAIGVAGALIIGATIAFFSDTETSTGNLLQAGEIDLKIDNESYVTDPETGRLVASTETSWDLRDLTVEKFFDFEDLKPGDVGEDTISIHVGSNDAWLCAAARITDDSDQTCTEPELGDDPSCTDPGLGQGELDEEVNIAFWGDDGDNVFEDGEEIFLEGPISGLGEQGQIALADSSGGPLGPGPVQGGDDANGDPIINYIGKAWCFGTMTPDPRPDREDPNPAINNPLIRGTGFDCDGSGVDNAAQTDKVVGDLQFYAEQSRNNPEFLCEENYTPVWPTPTPTPTP